MDIRRAVLRIRTLRLISQIVFFLLLNAVLFGVEPSALLLPILQSLGNPAATAGDAFAVMQYQLYQRVVPWLPLASLIVFTVLLGRMLCAWICPFGFIQDILGFLKRRHREISLRTHNEMLYIKYLILGLVLFISLTVSLSVVAGLGNSYRNALGVFAQAPFNALSPHDTLFGVLPVSIFNVITAEAPFAGILEGIGSIPVLFWVRLFILALVIVFSVYTPRSWCKYLCPVGAEMALLNHFSFLGLKRDPVQCTKSSCRRCVEACPMRVPILDQPWEKFTHPECTYCLECVDACKTRAIRPKYA
ncbi:MAG: 4Fe-4S binding protein [Candidatus Bathyarchaeota archaeon]|nr:MAG: 4Fe-4S binding protein [Candidatus Bathyarchaeota archaeon]